MNVNSEIDFTIKSGSWYNPMYNWTLLEKWKSSFQGSVWTTSAVGYDKQAYASSWNRSSMCPWTPGPGLRALDGGWSTNPRSRYNGATITKTYFISLIYFSSLMPEIYINCVNKLESDLSIRQRSSMFWWPDRRFECDHWLARSVRNLQQIAGYWPT